MNTIYLLLGSNMGDNEQQLLEAIKNIEQQIGKITQRSSLYSTAAWGESNQPDFLNQVLIVESEIAAQPLLNIILSIEKKMGRVRTTKNAPRVIDIDILFFNKEIIATTNLTVPHPEIENRRFVLIPLNELSPELLHPVSGLPMNSLLKNCTDTLAVKKI